MAHPQVLFSTVRMNINHTGRAREMYGQDQWYQNSSVLLYTHDSNSDNLVLKLSPSSHSVATTGPCRWLHQDKREACSLPFENSCFLFYHIFPLEVLYRFGESYQYLLSTYARMKGWPLASRSYCFDVECCEHLPIGNKRKETSVCLSFSPAHTVWGAAEKLIHEHCHLS